MVVTDNTMRTKNNITQPNTSTFTYINSIEVEQQFLQAVTELAVNTTHVFVTGAGGFLGTAICRLLRLANIKVTGFARGRYPDLEQLGVIMVQGDIRPRAI